MHVEDSQGSELVDQQLLDNPVGFRRGGEGERDRGLKVSRDSHTGKGVLQQGKIRNKIIRKKVLNCKI